MASRRLGARSAVWQSCGSRQAPPRPMPDTPLWTPDPASLGKLPLSLFMEEAGRRSGRPIADYDALHAWSVADPAAFWDLVWDFSNVIGEKGARRFIAGETMR